MVTQWLACGTKITPFLKAHWKGFISQHPSGGPETVVFLWSTLFTFSSLYFYFVFLLCLQCENVCSKLTYVIASDTSEEMFLLFNKNLFIFCRGWSCFQHRSNSEDRGSSTRQLQWKVTSFFSMVLLSVWKTHKWQEDVTLRECILSWNKTQNYAKINKTIFIAESSG